MKFEDVVKFWHEGEDVPIDDDGNILSEWAGFQPGTDREEVWSWLEEQNKSFSVAAAIDGEYDKEAT